MTTPQGELSALPLMLELDDINALWDRKVPIDPVLPAAATRASDGLYEGSLGFRLADGLQPSTRGSSDSPSESATSTRPWGHMIAAPGSMGGNRLRNSPVVQGQSSGIARATSLGLTPLLRSQNVHLAPPIPGARCKHTQGATQPRPGFGRPPLQLLDEGGRPE